MAVAGTPAPLDVADGSPPNGRSAVRPTADRWAWWRDLEAFSSQRLGAALEEFRVEKTRREQDSPGPWARSADEHAQNAQRALDRDRFEAGWSALKAAQRELIESYDETEALVEADRILREARDKLDGWRREAIEDALSSAWKRLGDAARLRERVTMSLEALGDADDATAADLRDRVRAAMSEVPRRDQDEELAELRTRIKAARQVLDVHQDNTYLKLRLLSRHLLWAGVLLLVTLAVAVGTVAIVLGLGWSPSGDEELFADARSVLVVVLLGAVGGATSGLITVLNPGTQLRIPDVKAQRYLVLLRPLVGAAAALIVVAILQSGLGGVQADARAALAVAFIAGFSERLVSRAVAAASSAIAK
jgi:hypothetical protein